MKAYYTKNTEKASFKLFTKDGKEVTLDANNKIKFNGKSNVKVLDVVNSLNTSEDVTASQLVTYSTNADNKITAINTAVDNSESGAVNTDKFTKNYDLTNAKFSKTLSKVGNVRVDDNTVIFDITENTDDYAIRSLCLRTVRHTMRQFMICLKTIPQKLWLLQIHKLTQQPILQSQLLKIL